MTAFFCIILAYLVGAIPSGLVLSRGSGIDIRTRGSGNIGATNVARLLGKKLGALTLLCDIAKGFLPVCLAAPLLGRGPALALVGAATVLGHMYPVYLRFRGGKGVATALGLFLYLAPWAVVAALALFLVVVRCTGFVSAGSLAAAALMPVAVWLFCDTGGEPWRIALACFVGLMIWIKHRANIVRLLNGTEQSWKKKDEGKAP